MTQSLVACDLEGINELITGINLNDYLSAEGHTCLHAAAFSGRADIIKALINGGAQVSNIKNKWGMTAYDIAMSRGHQEAAELLRPITEV